MFDTYTPRSRFVHLSLRDSIRSMKEVKYVERNQEVTAAVCSTQTNADWVRGIYKILHVHVIVYCKSLYISMHLKGEGLRFALDLIVYPPFAGFS